MQLEDAPEKHQKFYPIHTGPIHNGAHSHGASALTLLIYFEWSGIKLCQTELWVRRVDVLLVAEVENFSTF